MPFFRKKKGKNKGEIKILTAQETQKLTDRHFRTVAGLASSAKRGKYAKRHGRNWAFQWVVIGVSSALDFILLHNALYVSGKGFTFDMKHVAPNLDNSVSPFSLLLQCNLLVRIYCKYLFNSHLCVVSPIKRCYV